VSAVILILDVATICSFVVMLFYVLPSHTCKMPPIQQIPLGSFPLLHLQSDPDLLPSGT
jgi:hypothetical protein